jgi:hypothetical protein
MRVAGGLPLGLQLTAAHGNDGSPLRGAVRIYRTLHRHSARRYLCSTQVLRIRNDKSPWHLEWVFPVLSGTMHLAETTLHHGNQPLTQCQHPLRRHLVQRALKYQKRQPVHA